EAERVAKAEALLKASAEMGYLPAMGRLARMLPDHQKDQAVEYLAVMKKALGPNFDTAATKGTPEYQPEFEAEMTAVKQKFDVDAIAPAAEQGVGLTPEESLRGFVY
ncbi:MAG TPA: hypothetical protein PLO23_10105, partial [Alphaproteobacteria bacterium]|nr:hypothetical protein [Alphaproteobacteria bacterium]